MPSLPAPWAPDFLERKRRLPWEEGAAVRQELTREEVRQPFRCRFGEAGRRWPAVAPKIGPMLQLHNPTQTQCCYAA